MAIARLELARPPADPLFEASIPACGLVETVAEPLANGLEDLGQAANLVGLG